MSGDIEGHWRRAWLKAPGVADHDTCVHWLQVGDLFADIRIPAERPDVRGAQALSDLPDAALAQLLKAEGFAGHTVVKNDVCTWNRELNWHGRPGDADIGRLTFDGSSDRLIEDGMHADYTELWHRADDFPVHAGRLYAKDGMALLVTVGNRFVFASGPLNLPAADEAEEELASGTRGPCLAQRFSNGYIFGHWMGEKGVADLATNPIWERRPVLTLSEAGVTLQATDFFGEFFETEFSTEVAQAPELRAVSA